MSSKTGESSSAPSSDDVDMLMSITGAPRDLACHLLESCGGNIQAAVDLHLDGDVSHTFTTPASTSTSSTNVEQDNASAPTLQSTSPDVRAPIPQVTEVMVDETHRVPAYRTSNRRRDNNSVFDSLRDFQAETRDYDQGESSDKKRTLQDLFRPPIDIIFKGTFRSASIFAEQQNRWLLVNVQKSQEFSCQILNRDVWSLFPVKEYVKNKFIFWQGYHDSTDGTQYLQYYQIHDWPHIAILDPRTGEVKRELKGVTDDNILPLLKEFIFDNPVLDSSQVDQTKVVVDVENDNILDSTEDQQLKEAIRLSLQDGPSSSKSNIRPSIIISDDEDDDFEVETFTSDDDSRSSLIFQQKSSSSLTTSFKDIKKQEKQETSISPATKVAKISLQGPTVTLQFRFPNGEKKQLTLPKASQLQALIDDIESQNYPSDKYELITTFPRRKLSEMDSSRTLLDIGLDSQEVIYVQSI